MTGTGQSALLLGVPTWTSTPITVTPGESLTLSVDVSSVDLSSAPSVGVAYLGSAGEVLSIVNLVSVPTATAGFTTLQQVLTVPQGVAALRIVLTGFSPTEIHTTGTVTFDDVRLE